MRYIEKFSRAGARRLLLASASLLLCGAPSLIAQDFEKTYGRTDNEIGKAVRMTADQGYITAGYTQDPNTLETQAYVVRMHMNGATLWERRFDIGNASQTFGMDVKQLSNGDHVIVGSVGTPGCTGCTHIYAVRFTDAGDLVWYRTYGDRITNQYATSVIEPLVTVNPIDQENLVIAGYSEDGSGNKLGILMRLERTGDIRWVNQYDPDPLGSPKDNQLMSVNETDGGDIVATGFAKLAATDYDVWVLRVDKSNGTIIGGFQGSATFGTGAEDRGYSILALRNGHPDDLVIAGESYGRSAVASSSPEILMLQTHPNPCDSKGQRAAQFIGDNNSKPNYARCVREITSSQLGTLGDLLVTGASYSTTFAGSLDLFMQVYKEGALNPVTPHYVFGGMRDDGGNGIAESLGSLGFIATGFTQSNPPAPVGDRSDLYIVHTDAAFASCTSTPLSLSSQEADLAQVCNHPTIISPEWSVLCAADGNPLGWSFDLCE